MESVSISNYQSQEFMKKLNKLKEGLKCEKDSKEGNEYEENELDFDN